MSETRTDAVGPRAIDHLVLSVHDLETARATYRRLGFALTPPATHPFGTRNSLVQLPGFNFLELLALGDTAAVPAQEPVGQFSFARRSERFLRDRGEGMSMLVCGGDDARADVQAFRAAGLETFDPFDFARDATLPDGSVVTVAFSLAIVTDAALPGLALFTCQQRHTPDKFWKPDYQRHPNGAQRIVEVIMEADAPAAVAAVLARFTGGNVEVEEGGHAARVGPPSDRICVVTPGALHARYPELSPAPTSGLPRFAAFRVAVADVATVRAVLGAADVPHRAGEGAVVVPPAAAHGMIIEFT